MILFSLQLDSLIFCSLPPFLSRVRTFSHLPPPSSVSSSYPRSLLVSSPFSLSSHLPIITLPLSLRCSSMTQSQPRLQLLQSNANSVDFISIEHPHSKEYLVEAPAIQDCDSSHGGKCPPDFWPVRNFRWRGMGTGRAPDLDTYVAAHRNF
jgi:hypothetical protein